MSTIANERTTTLDLLGVNAILLENQKLPAGRRDKVHVFRGLFNGTTPIAIKRYEKEDRKIRKKAKKALKNLSALQDPHKNIIRYFGKAEMGEYL